MSPRYYGTVLAYTKYLPCIGSIDKDMRSWSLKEFLKYTCSMLCSHNTNIYCFSKLALHWNECNLFKYKFVLWHKGKKSW